MKIVTDLKTIKKVAEKKEDENWQFRSFLKAYDIEVEELDSIVHGLFVKGDVGSKTTYGFGKGALPLRNCLTCLGTLNNGLCYHHR
jgi:hypothetical protein